MKPETKKIIAKIFSTIVLPGGILIGLYFAGKYTLDWYRRYKAKKGGLPVNTIGMEPYVITVPFKYQDKYFTNSQFFNLIENIDYSMLSDNVVMDNDKMPQIIEIHILAKPKDIDKFEKIFEAENSEIKISPETNHSIGMHQIPLLTSTIINPIEQK